MKFTYFLYEHKKKCIIGAIAFIVLVAVIIGVIMGFSKNDTVIDEETPKPSQSVVVVPEETETPIPEKEEMKVITGVISDIIDYSTSYIYTINIDGEKTIKVKADINTIFVNLEDKSVISPMSIRKNDTVSIFTLDSIETETVSVQVLGAGEDNGYAFDKIIDIKQMEDGYLCTLEKSEDLLLLNDESLLYNGYLQGGIAELNLISKDDFILYKYEPKSDIIENNVCLEGIIIYD